MRIRLLDPGIHPRFDDLPWSVPLDEWDHPRLVDLPTGLHRHVVRFVDYGGQYYAVKELPARPAAREFRLLRELNDEGLPVVAAVALVDRRGDPEPALVTRYLNYALPYRYLYATSDDDDPSPVLVDSLATLLTRLHVAGFYWGDGSLSNALFRRDAGRLSAFALDVETAELHPRLSDGQRSLDLETAVTNVAGGLADLAASGGLPDGVDPFDVATRVGEAYEAIWGELHDRSGYDPLHPVEVEGRLSRLHELGFDVREAVITGDPEHGTLEFTPVSVDDGPHRRELHRLTGILAREYQARRLLDDIDDHRRTLPAAISPEEAAHRWLIEAFDPVMAAIPAEVASKLERPQLYLEVLDHRRRLGPGWDAVQAAHDYASTVLSDRPHERALPPLP